jgi:hypothetical protein
VAQRSELYDRPFRVIFLDSMGPISPASDGNSYILHAVCPWSKFAFLKAVPEDTAEQWAKFLVEEVYLNLAGFPAVLRTDRGKAPLGEVVAAVNRWLGVTHAFGSSYHPQSQHTVEGQHQRPNRILKAFVEGNPGSWSRFVAVAQWALRATPRADLGGLSPYELLTGLRPQGPLSSLFEKTPTKTLDPTSYVADLQQCLLDLKKHLNVRVAADVEQRRARHLREAGGAPAPFAVGDHAFLKRAPDLLRRSSEGTSNRLLPYADPRVLRVWRVASPSTVFLEDAASGERDLSFAQPVHVSRLVPHTVCALEEPLGEAPQLELIEADGSSVRGRIIAQTATGAVRFEEAGEGQHVMAGTELRSRLIRLDEHEFRWLR